MSGGLALSREELLALVRRYDVPVDPAALRSALDDEHHGRLLWEWARSHLTADTLLTKDELNTYHLIERNGRAQELAASADLSTVQPIGDQDIEDAIEELNRSTAAINKQTEALRQQQDALSRLISTNGKTGDARSNLQVRRLHKWESDRKAINSTVELLSQGLVYRVSELDQQVQGSGGDAANIVDDVLHSDDKLLSSLQKLGWELDTEDPEEAESVNKLRDICARLIKFTVECIRTKLDRLFLESLEAAKASGASDHVPKEDITAQQQELEELYSEILPVAQMSVEQQWLEPSLRSLSAKNGNSVGRSAEALGYILDCFDYLIDRIDNLTARVSSLKAHETATASLLATAKTELSTTVISPPQRSSTGDSFFSPSRRPQSLITDAMMTPAPFRAVPANDRSKRRSSVDAIYESPLDHLLGELTLFLPSSNGPSDNPAQAHSNYLSKALADRARKSAEVASSLQFAFESDASSHLADARTALQLIRDSVLAESPFAEVHLVDPGIESSIGVLSQEVHNVASRLEGVEREAAALTRGRNVKRDEIVARWAR